MILVILLSVVLACLLVLAGVLLAWSPGSPRSFVDEKGRPPADSVSEKVRVAINGMEQGMFIEGRDATKPVLLFVHGGPGMPEYFLTRTHPTGLEDDFVICWWEQRGSGLSYRSDIRPGSMTVEQLVSDTLAVTEYLRRRFGKEKIYLLGHSWGSFIGILAAQRAPECYHAYIGMGQIAKQRESERLAYDYELKEFRRRGNARMVRRLEAAPVGATGPLPSSYMAIRDTAMHRLGIGTTRDMKSVVSGIFVPTWRVRAYTLGEKVAIWRGKRFSHRLLWDELLTSDLPAEVSELQVPVYFCHGKYDYTASYAEARSYFTELKAPVKGFYTFAQSAHSPLFEEPEKMRRLLREDALASRTHLADGAGNGNG